MPRVEKARYLNFYILNIKLRNRNNTKDFEPEDYVRLFRKVFRDKIHKESSPNKHCIFKFLFEEKDKNKTKYLSGTFAQFTYIQNDKWFNLKSLDLDKEFHIPDGLFPDAKIGEFVFIPSAHRFCYKITSDFKVPPYAVKKFLDFALDQAADNNQFVQVDVETDKSSLQKILSARVIKKLIIDINYSNVDIGRSLKKFVENDIKASNSSRLKLEATQKPDTSIDVKKSKILNGAIQASMSNGETEAKIIDENYKVQTIKTTNFPRKEAVYGVSASFNELVFKKIIKIFRRKK